MPFSLQRILVDGNPLTRIIQILQQDPGSVSGDGLQRLAVRYGLDVFRDVIEDGQRISLAGKIVLIDIDLDKEAKQVRKVSISLASSTLPSNVSHSFIRSNLPPRAEDVLLDALTDSAPSRGLHRPLNLLRFSSCLALLSRIDKPSSETFDLFLAVDEVAHVYFRIYEKFLQVNPNVEYPWLSGWGQPLCNFNGRLGFAIRYWTAEMDLDDQQDKQRDGQRDHVMYLGIREKPKSPHTGWTPARCRTDWLAPEFTMDPDGSIPDACWPNPEAGTSGSSASASASAPAPASSEFVFMLYPAVYVERRFAERIHATIVTEKELKDAPLASGEAISKKSILDSQNLLEDRYKAVFLHDYLRFRKVYYDIDPEAEQRPAEAIPYDVDVSNYVPEDMVKILEFPLAHPRDLLPIVRQLRLYSLHNTISRNVLKDNVNVGTAEAETEAETEVEADESENDTGVSELPRGARETSEDPSGYDTNNGNGNGDGNGDENGGGNGTVDGPAPSELLDSGYGNVLQPTTLAEFLSPQFNFHAVRNYMSIAVQRRSSGELPGISFTVVLGVDTKRGQTVKLAVLLACCAATKWETRVLVPQFAASDGVYRSEAEETRVRHVLEEVLNKTQDLFLSCAWLKAETLRLQRSSSRGVNETNKMEGLEGLKTEVAV